ncbi:hypothetical protein FisN_8Hu126 [Fistulifera solaris]|uniref:Uncharacterized protein n=1 Tax=Fistulifera solaris TaxID=1519565 RepID=A0A1Z5JYL2_FISSO|nr:hypothetical protein FisN_8Hu126 [Fistulifera solaris]|eukprot:GAX18908.1 hypothetical protein FisN_8Hu126 [Fistulifera solaris]
MLSPSSAMSPIIVNPTMAGDSPAYSLKSTLAVSSQPDVSLSLTSLLTPKPTSAASAVQGGRLPILPAQDSLIRLRSYCKRRNQVSPLDDLRSLVASKRQRCEEATPRRVVRFDLEANQVYESKSSEKDLYAAWMSPLEHILVKKRLCEVIFLFRNGFLNPITDTIRGVEFRAYSGLAQQKQNKAKQYRQTILSHQNQGYLSQLSESLSAVSSKEAIELALFDAEEAQNTFLS